MKVEAGKRRGSVSAMALQSDVTRGVCRYCGCSEFEPCAIRLPTGMVMGCWWMNAEETVCSMPLCQQAAVDDGVLQVRGLVIAS